MIEPGTMLPDLTLLASDERPLPLRGFIGRRIVLYFYPKDDTAGCTREAQEFGALAGAFAAADTDVLGVSKDSPAKHRRFAEKHALAVALASDPDGVACEAFGVWTEKQLYGCRYFGIERATFLFAADGRLVRAWRKVRVPGHAEAVLAATRAL